MDLSIFIGAVKYFREVWILIASLYVRDTAERFESDDNIVSAGFMTKSVSIGWEVGDLSLLIFKKKRPWVWIVYFWAVDRSMSYVITAMAEYTSYQ